ncbi:hypothetical protein [Martelella limonii]|uniref:hypothetical protein n=1 Tax=Martelella limonii TaxID=1647649 RepID=UPI00157FC11C|nr:hypothetical protein [Martelella limonii]
MGRHGALEYLFFLFVSVFSLGVLLASPSLAEDGSCGLTDREIVSLAYPDAKQAADGSVDVGGANVAVAEVNSPDNRAWWILCKIWPSKPDLILVAVPLTTEASADYQRGDLELLVFDRRTNAIASRLRLKDALSSDAIAFERMAFDTALYRLSEDHTAFGIRKYYLGSAKSNPFAMTALSLFVMDGDVLKQVLEPLAVEQAKGETLGDCEGYADDRKRTIAIGKDIHSGFYDLVVTTVTSLTEMKFDESETCIDVYTEVNKTRQALSYDGAHYAIPSDMRGY